MKKTLIITFLPLILFSCSNSVNQENTVNESRYLYSITSDSYKMRTEFILTKTLTDSLIKYEYKSISDSTRNFESNYIVKDELLYLSLEGYKAFKENVWRSEKDTELWFDNYDQIDPIIDGMGPIMFNTKYGILVITGPLGPTHIFLSAKNDTLAIDEILNKLRH